ncbi:hypothetical protein F4777DRAFT_575091 [Nemania sp. FL0916]|nr:hypothetical protein F4777DRAFT_575091 [Nemania sp. FL0916]
MSTSEDHVFAGPGALCPKTPDQMGGSVKALEASVYLERSLEDLFCEHPNKRPEFRTLEPVTMSALANLIFHAVTQSGRIWYYKWASSLDLPAFLESISIGDERYDFALTKYTLMPSDFRARQAEKALAYAYKQCLDVHDLSSSGHFEFPQLFDLINKSIDFAAMVKDHECKTNLRNIKVMIQSGLAGLNAQKNHIVKAVAADFDALNEFYRFKTAEGDIEPEVLRKEQGERELYILDMITLDLAKCLHEFAVHILTYIRNLFAPAN